MHEKGKYAYGINIKFGKYDGHEDRTTRVNRFCGINLLHENTPHISTWVLNQSSSFQFPYLIAAIVDFGPGGRRGPVAVVLDQQCVDAAQHAEEAC